MAVGLPRVRESKCHCRFSRKITWTFTLPDGACLCGPHACLHARINRAGSYKKPRLTRTSSRSKDVFYERSTTVNRPSTSYNVSSTLRSIIAYYVYVLLHKKKFHYALTKTEFILMSIMFLTSAAKSRISRSPSFLRTLDSRSRYFYNNNCKYRMKKMY